MLSMGCQYSKNEALWDNGLRAPIQSEVQHPSAGQRKAAAKGSAAEGASLTGLQHA